MDLKSYSFSCQDALASNWRNYKDQDGNMLRVRPHWAKEFPLNVGGQDIYEYMRDVYSDQIPLFVSGRGLIDVTIMQC